MELSMEGQMATDPYSATAADVEQQQMIQKQQTQRQAICSMLFCIAASCYAIAALGITFFLFTHYQDNNAHMILDAATATHYAARSVTTGPIVDIKREEHCPDGYAQESIGTFYGMESGCLYQGEIRSFGCPKGAQSILETTPFELYYWDNYTFCIKRNSDVRYGYQTCPSSHKACGDGYACVPNTEDCPINKIGIVEKNAIPPGMKSTPIQHRALVFSNEGQGDLPSPLWQIRAFPSNAPCLAENLMPNRTHSTNYPLSMSKTGCGKYGDDIKFSVVLDAVTEENYYRINGVYGQLTREYPTFNTYISAEPVGLFARTTVRVTNKDCLDKDFSSLSVVSHAMTTMHKRVKTLNNVALVTTGICNLLMLCFTAAVYAASKQQHESRSRKAIALASVIGCLIGIEIFMNSFYGIYVLFYEREYNSSADRLSSFAGLSCFDGVQWNAALSDFTSSSQIDDYRLYFRWPKYLLIASVVLVFLIMSLFLYIKRSRAAIAASKSHLHNVSMVAHLG
jgi:cytochrome bd-type quinol oxidase subunit 2